MIFLVAATKLQGHWSHEQIRVLVKTRQTYKHTYWHSHWIGKHKFVFQWNPCSGGINALSYWLICFYPFDRPQWWNLTYWMVVDLPCRYQTAHLAGLFISRAIHGIMNILNFSPYRKRDLKGKNDTIYSFLTLTATHTELKTDFMPLHLFFIDLFL